MAVISGQRHRHPADDDACVRRRFHAGEVRLRDGTCIAPTDTLPPGTDVFFYRMPAPEPPCPYPLRIVYMDDDLVVVDKPPFLATTPRGSHITETAVVVLRRMLQDTELSPAHRLDRMTSGLVLFTRRASLRGPYQGLFEKNLVTKEYQAVAPYSATLASRTPVTWESRIEKKRGTLQGREVPGPPNAVTTLHSVTPIAEGESGKSDEQTTKPANRLGVYLLQPHTGKTHQLRIHMAAAGVPIIGDPLYPRILDHPENTPHPLQLRCTTLTLPNPQGGTPHTFHTPPTPPPWFPHALTT